MQLRGALPVQVEVQLHLGMQWAGDFFLGGGALLARAPPCNACPPPHTHCPAKGAGHGAAWCGGVGESSWAGSQCNLTKRQRRTKDLPGSPGPGFGKRLPQGLGFAGGRQGLLPAGVPPHFATAPGLARLLPCLGEHRGFGGDSPGLGTSGFGGIRLCLHPARAGMAAWRLLGWRPGVSRTSRM